jgi:hypothetical protein
MNAHDRKAMQLAIAMARADSEQQRHEIDDMLRAGPWQEAGERAVWACQDRNLRLRPWECPPFLTDSDAEPSDCWGRRPQEIALLARMLAARISRYHPDPIAALAAAEADGAA